MEDLFREILRRRAKMEDIVLTKEQEDEMVKQSAQQVNEAFKKITGQSND